VIGKVVRGRDVRGLLRYLFGPGRANEHQNPRVVAVWDGDVSGHQPAMAASGRHDVRTLARLLEQPLTLAVRPPRLPVWHCSLRTAPDDRPLTDAEWRSVARDVVTRVGLSGQVPGRLSGQGSGAPPPSGHRPGPLPRTVTLSGQDETAGGDVLDGDGCRWVAVRHADDHIHLVVTLARQDGRVARTSNDFYRLGLACQAVERRLDLTRTPGRDRTAARRPSRAEFEKATRAGRPEPARVQLARQVRVAAAAAMTGEEFLARLADDALLVRPRYSQLMPDQITGYAVAVPGDRTRDGLPVWFGGGKLAADLSWPKLSARWPDSATTRQSRTSVRCRLSGHERSAIWRYATGEAQRPAEFVRQSAIADPGSASDVAHATGRALSAIARLLEGRRGGQLTDAADAFDRASRELSGRTSQPAPVAEDLRAAVRLLALTGRASRDEAAQVLALVMALVMALAGLTEAVADLRQVQGRLAQASAARRAAEGLHRLSPPPLDTGPPRVPVAVHSARLTASIHSRMPGGDVPRTSRRKVIP